MPTDAATDARAALYAAAAPFLAALVAHPGEPEYRLAFADWLMERGADAESAGQRWAVKHGKRPCDEGWAFAGDNLWIGHCQLPLTIAPKGAVAGSAVIGPSSRRLAESAFLARCGELTWGDDGEPIP